MRRVNWRVWLGVGLVLFLALVAVGCAGGNPQITTTRPVIVDGKVVMGDDGKPLTETTTAPVEADFYDKQAKNEPIFEMRAPANAPITLPAGAHIVVRVPVTVRQYVPENVQMIREGKDLVPWIFGGFLSYQQGETARAGMAGARGNKTVINTQGDGSPVSAPGGNAGGTTGTNVPTTTTTTTTDNSGAK